MKVRTIWDIESRMTRLKRHARPREAANQARTLLMQLELVDVRKGDAVVDRILDSYNAVMRNADAAAPA